VPPIPAPVRAAVRARLAADGPAALHAELARHDPAGAAALKPGDGVRIVRALEVIAATGRPLSAWHRDGMAPLVDPARAAAVFLAPARDELKQRIDARFDAMMAAGAKRDTWRYTKRQFTWFRHQLPGWPWAGTADAARMVDEALKPLMA
jgi:tRNA dimethylallyltransferase